MNRKTTSLSGGERQRIKLAKYLDKKGNIYVVDEPTTGLHASDVAHNMIRMDQFVKRGNTVIIIEHNLDVMKQADYMIDIEPNGGRSGGDVVFCGTPQQMVNSCEIITAKYLKVSLR